MDRRLVSEICDIQTAGLPSQPTLFFNLDTVEKLTMRVILFALLCWLAGLASAQFQFFEQMFNQGGQQQQQQQQQQAQNVASDSEWYQRTYESGIFHPLYSVPFSPLTMLISISHCSSLLELPLPRHPCLRSLPASLSLSFSGRRR